MNYRFFVDYGWSGANFQRPGFAEMMDYVENGEVKCVITKDLSRMGRSYLQVGMFTELTLPKKGVRFIAINDGVDSAQSDNDLTPLKNLFNEWMIRDTSRKIKAVFRGKSLSGKPIASQPVYGCLRGEDETFVIVPRIPPLSLKKDTYPFVQGKAMPETIPEGYKSSVDFGLSLALKLADEYKGLGQFCKKGMKNAVGMWFGTLPSVMAVGAVALVIVNAAPIFEILGKPFLLLLSLLRVPEAKAASATMIVG